MLHEAQCNVSEIVVNQGNILQRFTTRKRLDPVSEKPAKLLLL
jgi:ribosomal protein L22